MKTLKVPLRQAQKVKQQLIDSDLFHPHYQITKDKEFIYLPLKKIIKTKYKVVEKKLKKIQKTQSLRQALKTKLTKSELSYLKTAFDTM